MVIRSRLRETEDQKLEAVMADTGASTTDAKTVRTLTIEVEVDSKLALTIIDSGAPCNFISKRFVSWI